MDYATITMSLITGVIGAFIGAHFKFRNDKRMLRHTSLKENAGKVFDAMIDVREALDTDFSDCDPLDDGGMEHAVKKGFDAHRSALRLGTHQFADWKLAMRTASSFAHRNARTVYEKNAVAMRENPDMYYEHDGEWLVPFNFDAEYEAAARLVERVIAQMKHLLEIE